MFKRALQVALYRWCLAMSGIVGAVIALHVYQLLVAYQVIDVTRVLR